MNTQETQLLKLLKSFDDNGCSDHLILIDPGRNICIVQLEFYQTMKR